MGVITEGYYEEFQNSHASTFLMARTLFCNSMRDNIQGLREQEGG